MKDLRKPIAHEMGLQVSRGVHPEVPTEEDFRYASAALGEIFRELAKQKESRIVEGHLMADHVHMCISIPPKRAVSSVVEFIKGKSEVAPVCGQLGGLFKVYSGCRSSCQNLLGSIFLSPLLRRWVSGQGA